MKIVIITIFLLFSNIALRAQNEIKIYIFLPSELYFNSSKTNGKALIKFNSKFNRCDNKNELERLSIEGLCHGKSDFDSVNMNDINISLNLSYKYLKTLINKKKKEIFIITDRSALMTEDNVETEDCERYEFVSSLAMITNPSENDGKIQILKISISEKRLIKAMLKGNRDRRKKIRKQETELIKDFFNGDVFYNIFEYIHFELKVKCEIITPHNNAYSK